MRKIKFLAFFLLISLLFTQTAFAAALTDISGHKNETAIQYLYDNNIIQGYPDGTFQPNKTVKRGELIKILVGGTGIQPQADQYKNCFPDVNEEWFAPYVCYAKEQGWIQGYPDNTFKPGNDVNKVEAIKMLIESQEYMIPGVLTPTPLFDDVARDQWYAIYIAGALDKGLLETTSGNYYPTNSKTRASISENIYRAMIIKQNSLDNFGAYANPGAYQVTNVVDGDTIDINMDGVEKRIRLIGINTPETGQPYYAEAKAKLEDLILNKYVTLESDITDIDAFDRLLRYIYVDELFVNEEMVRLGLATSKAYPPDTKYLSVLDAAEQEAINNNLGIWTTSETEFDISVLNFHYDAEGNDNYNLNDEYVTLINNGPTSADMTGWTMIDDAVHTYYFPSFTLEAGASVTVYTGIGSNTANSLYWNQSGSAVWNNGGDVLYLKNSEGELVYTKVY